MKADSILDDPMFTLHMSKAGGLHTEGETEMV